MDLNSRENTDLREKTENVKISVILGHPMAYSLTMYEIVSKSVPRCTADR